MDVMKWDISWLHCISLVKYTTALPVAYLKAFDQTVVECLALGAESSIAFFRTHQSCVQVVQAMFQVREPDVPNFRWHHLCRSPRLRDARLVR